MDVLLRIEEEVEKEKNNENMEGGFIPEERVEIDGELVVLGNKIYREKLKTIFDCFTYAGETRFPIFA